MGHYDDAYEAEEDRLDQFYIEKHGVTYSEYLEIGKLTKEISDYVSIEDKGKRLSHLRSKLK
jgi:hypothetical protein